MSNDRDRELGAALLGLPTPGHAPGFWEELEARLDLDVGDVLDGHRRRRDSRRAVWLVSMAAAVALVLAAAVLLPREDGTRLRVTPPAMRVPPTTATSAPPPTATDTTGPPDPGGTVAPDLLDAGDPLLLTGIGPVTAGMTLEQASAAAGRPITRNASGDPTKTSCYFADPSPDDFGVSFMVVDGVVGSVYVDGESPVRTLSGIGVGASEAQVKKAYGERIVVEPHAYDEAGHYLRYVPDDTRYSLVFETHEGVVTSFRSGLAAPVGYTEGCS